MQIEAAIARAQGASLSLETIDIEEPRDNEILVKVVATGVCHTDIVVRDGMLPTPLPVVLGHEGAGIVEKVGRAVSKVKAGDKVVMTFNSCGHCPSCLDHHISYCHEFFPRNFFASRTDGSSALSAGGERIHGNFFGQSSFATHAICHEVNVVKVPDTAPLELLGPLACGIQTGAGAVMNALKVSAGKSFAVFGSGSVGLSALMAAKVVGATTIVAVDMNDERLAMARELGATHTINPGKVDATAEIIAITSYGLNFALDTTGISSVIRCAVIALAPMGAYGILGASAMGTEINLDEVHFMSGGRRLIGIVEGEANPDTFIPILAEFYAQGRFPFDKFVKFYDFDEINQAIHDSESGKTIKPIVRMQ
ncbi:NAD(P)-dependent alcohol dehydrogenase [Rhizobium johnstonii]|uniref:NAD(P)-dependent alcohol dehydrogenase n=1 Tax=Rhizobium TaxID=379 RepID=UPI00103277BD|nr:NAD(P)-dependent alcohol dehydrogenase [Rhizobium leguminosarum]TBF43743.1 NAD(P)-dependent alcohol dehydrogenase [Rhizobium leguminosarum]TBF86388.1 NAD(P)-dependent alcohol dehydrogenase [Rhizobium leguminosarum]TBG08387.1 NAD(P)-dependent alcohol dehydrogenase [Rhizobium leguminosarum]TBG28531.1 NAD(P)-dependent alcohol dehydrogenase [Rhizobium leguminosarum]TBG51621.1 NAD(P)-dependent alcohol dehydrogenase [Rhizobium leguminosarum]